MNRLTNTLTVPLLVLLTTLAAAIALLIMTADIAHLAQRDLDSHLTQLREARTRVQKSGSEKDLIARNLPDYQKLAALGFVGDEQRINWLDALRNANQKGGMFGINYDIAPKKAYPHAIALGAGQLTLAQSVMKLRFQMLHEGDLAQLFEHLSEQNAGVFIVNRCSLRRGGATFAVRYQPNMNAECELAWITAQAPRASEVNK